MLEGTKVEVELSREFSQKNHSTMFDFSVHSVPLDKTASIVALLMTFGTCQACNSDAIVCGHLKLIVAPLVNFNRQVCNSDCSICAAAC